MYISNLTNPTNVSKPVYLLILLLIASALSPLLLSSDSLNKLDRSDSTKNNPTGEIEIDFNRTHTGWNESILVTFTLTNLSSSFGYSIEWGICEGNVNTQNSNQQYQQGNNPTSNQFLKTIVGTSREGKGLEIACAQLCGITHYRMRGYLTVDTEEEYSDWLASEAEYLDFGDDEDEWGDDEDW